MNKFEMMYEADLQQNFGSLENFRMQMATINPSPIDPQIKLWWLESLRSGKYAQGRNRLITKQYIDNNPVVTYCCLGVLCELPTVGYTPEAAMSFGQAFIPDPQAAHLGMDFKVQQFLAITNDDRAWTFDKIADWIEVYL